MPKRQGAAWRYAGMSEKLARWNLADRGLRRCQSHPAQEPALQGSLDGFPWGRFCLLSSFFRCAWRREERGENPALSAIDTIFKSNWPFDHRASGHTSFPDSFSIHRFAIGGRWGISSPNPLAWRSAGNRKERRLWRDNASSPVQSLASSSLRADRSF